MSDEERAAIHELAHALRTPIAVIQGFADLLARDGDPGPSAQQRRDYVARIKTATAEMRQTLDDAVAKVDASA